VIEGKTLAVATLKKLWKNEYFKTALMIILIISAVFGFWYGSQLVLNTQYPVLAVASGSMCTVQRMYCDGWSHPFSPTLHIGDLIIVQGVNPKEIKAESGTGDIIVFHKPKLSESLQDELIVHRAVESEINPDNELVYFETRGDANLGSDSFGSDYRGENYTWHNKISEKLVVGKVVLRIPWIGHIALFMHNSSGVYIIIIIIIIFVIVEFVIPEFTRKEEKTEQKETVEKAFEDKPL
jgi:signal peptidase I